MSLDVFLCHNSKDKPIVRRIGEFLKHSGLQPWIDEEGLAGGCRWQDELSRKLLESQAVLVCCGPDGIGPWQTDEIEMLVQKRRDAKRPVIPVVLPSCLEKEPEIPLWLQSRHLIDFRKTDSPTDPFNHLLFSIDERNSKGHHRPSILVVRDNSEVAFANGSASQAENLEPAAARISRRLVHESASTFHRVQFLSYDDPLLSTNLELALSSVDVVVSVLSRRSFNPLPQELFVNGLAAGIRNLSEQRGLKVIEWRDPAMLLPEDPLLERSFRATAIATCLDADLIPLISDAAERRFHAGRVKVEHESTQSDQHRAILGYPAASKDGKRFVRKFTDGLAQNAVNCDAPPKWQHVLDGLREVTTPYEALLIVLNGDDGWLSECTGELRRLQRESSPQLPPVRAFVHAAEDEEDADPIPVRLDKFREYFGLRDLQKLAKDIAAQAGVAET